MATEETKEQQQIYNIFRSCIYLILIFELIVNLPLEASDPITKFFMSFLYKLKLFNSVLGCKFMELVCIGVTCIGTRAKKELKFNMKTMVVYPLAIGFYLLVTSVLVHKDMWGRNTLRIPYQSYDLCDLLCYRHHANTSGAGRYQQILQP